MSLISRNMTVRCLLGAFTVSFQPPSPFPGKVENWVNSNIK